MPVIAEKSTLAKPFLKWAEGKTRLIAEIQRRSQEKLACRPFSQITNRIDFSTSNDIIVPKLEFSLFLEVIHNGENRKTFH